MTQAFDFRILTMALAVGGAAVLGSSPVWAQSDPIPTGQTSAEGLLTAPPNVDASADAAAGKGPQLNLLSTTYAAGNFGGGVLKPGKSYRFTDLRTLTCPAAQCTLRFTGQVQLEGTGNNNGNNATVCFYIDKKVGDCNIIQGQLEKSTFTTINASAFQTVKKGAHKLYGALASVKGGKAYFFTAAWDLYK